MNKRYAIKFLDTYSYLKKPTAPYGNYYSDNRASHYDQEGMIMFKSKVVASVVAYLLKGVVLDFHKPFRYEVGVTYERLDGKPFKVVSSHEKNETYETISNEEGKGRYNRTGFSYDKGRVTGGVWCGDSLKYPPVKFMLDGEKQ